MATFQAKSLSWKPLSIARMYSLPTETLCNIDKRDYIEIFEIGNSF